MWKTKKVRLLVAILSIVGYLALINIGGKLYVNRKEEQKAKDLLAVERQSVKVLKNTFVDIAEVEFS